MEKFTVKTIIERVKSETPIFWKKIRRIGIGAGLVGGAVKAAIETHSMDLNWMQPDYYNSMILVGVIFASLASLAAEPKPIDPIKNESN